MVLFALIVVSVLLISAKFAMPNIWDESVAPDSAPAQVFQFLYFISNTLLVVVAFTAMRFARTELHESERTRKAGVFLEIEARWASEKMKSSRLRLTKLAKEWEAHASGYCVLDDYIDFRLERMPLEDMVATTEILAFAEMLGLMVRRDYVDVEDIDLLLRGAILQVRRIFSSHIARRRKSIPRAYDNALWLADEMAGRQKRTDSV